MPEGNKKLPLSSWRFFFHQTLGFSGRRTPSSCGRHLKDLQREAEQKKPSGTVSGGTLRYFSKRLIHLTFMVYFYGFEAHNPTNRGWWLASHTKPHPAWQKDALSSSAADPNISILLAQRCPKSIYVFTHTHNQRYKYTYSMTLMSRCSLFRRRILLVFRRINHWRLNICANPAACVKCPRRDLSKRWWTVGMRSTWDMVGRCFGTWLECYNKLYI